MKHGQPKQHRSPEAEVVEVKFANWTRQLWVVERPGEQVKKVGGVWVERIPYLTMRLTRLFSISYTPSFKTSFLSRRTGPSSGSTHGHPLVARSGSVAARKMAPATRSAGVMGMPTVRALDFQSIILVSEQTANYYYYYCYYYRRAMGTRRAREVLTREPWVDACCADVVALCEGV